MKSLPEQMSEETARQILADVSCGCDGRGVRPGPDGRAIPCSRCSGTFRSNDDLKAARSVLAQVEETRS